MLFGRSSGEVLIRAEIAEKRCSWATLFPPYLQNNKTTLVAKIRAQIKLKPYLPYLAPQKIR